MVVDLVLVGVLVPEELGAVEVEEEEAVVAAEV